MLPYLDGEILGGSSHLILSIAVILGAVPFSEVADGHDSVKSEVVVIRCVHSEADAPTALRNSTVGDNDVTAVVSTYPDHRRWP